MSATYLRYPPPSSGSSGGGGGTSAIWGNITGTLSNQTDLYKVISTEYDAGNSGATKTIDWSNGNNQVLVMTANCTITLSNPVVGQRYVLRLKEDNTGSRVVTWPGSVTWPSSTAPTLSGANKTDFIEMYYFSTGYIAKATLNYPNPSTGFQPSDISGLQLWLDGNDATTFNGGTISNGASVSAWRDKSGNSNNSAQGSGSLQPVWNSNVVNSLGAVTFLRQTLSFAGHAFWPANAAWDTFMVMKWDGFESANNFFFSDVSTTAHPPMWGTNSGGTFFQWIGQTGEWSANNYTQALETTNFHLVEVNYDNTSPTSTSAINMRYDRGNLTRSAGSNSFGTGTNLGSPDGTLEANFMFKGKVACLLIYNTKLGTTDRANVEDWVNRTYGI